MIIETFKVVSSFFPFLKEIFLWRDGAEEGKPVTKQNLIRRKIAVFVLLGSIVVNYIACGKLIEFYKLNVTYKEQVTELQNAIKDKPPVDAKCVKPEELNKALHDELELQFDKHLPKRHKSNPHS